MTLILLTAFCSCSQRMKRCRDTGEGVRVVTNTHEENVISKTRLPCFQSFQRDLSQLYVYRCEWTGFNYAEAASEWCTQGKRGRWRRTCLSWLSPRASRTRGVSHITRRLTVWAWPVEWSTMIDIPVAVTSEAQCLIKLKPNICRSPMNGGAKGISRFIGHEGQKKKWLIDSTDGGTLNTDAPQVRALNTG